MAPWRGADERLDVSTHSKKIRILCQSKQLDNPLRFTILQNHRTISCTFTIQDEKIRSQLRDIIDRLVLSLPVYTENTSALYSRGPSESKRRTLLVDITLDSMGNVYVADTYNDRIQFFLAGQSNGTTIAGITGSAGSTPDLLDGP